MIPPFRLSSSFVWKFSSSSGFIPGFVPPSPLLGGGGDAAAAAPGGGDGAGDASFTGKLHETVPSGLTVAVAGPTTSTPSFSSSFSLSTAFRMFAVAAPCASGFAATLTLIVTVPVPSSFSTGVTVTSSAE